MTGAPGPVIALVAGVHADRAVISWAAREAARRSSPLMITALPDGQALSEPMHNGSRALIDVMSRRARLQRPGLEVLAVRGGASALQHLVTVTAGASLLVVATNAADVEEPYLSPMTGRMLAVQARCPVVTLSPTARTRIDVEHGNVVLGWCREGSGRRALDVAADEAFSRAARLTVVMVLPAADGPGGRVLDRTELETELIAAVAAVERRCRGLVIDLLHPRGNIVAELCRAARQADLLVIGSHRCERGWNERPGSVAGVVMTMSPSPTLLVVESSFQRPRRLAQQAKARPDGGRDFPTDQL